MDSSSKADFRQAHVVIPTYNESGNIRAIVEAIAAASGRADLHIWVMDDNSPDGTAGVVESMRAAYPNLRAIVRTRNRGYGAAVAEGMRRALEAGAEWVITMDADFAHSPSILPAILECAAGGADLVIGSRYSGDGRPAVKDWPFWRLCMSRFGNWYFRTMLRVRARDNTAGYRCWRATMLRRILAEDLNATGYAFITESLFYAGWFGARVDEVPNLYLGRTQGESKLSARILLESLWTAFRLRAVKAGLISGPRSRPAPNPGPGR